MRAWRHYKRLLLNRATLSRVLSEIELERVRESLSLDLAQSTILVAGGGKSSRGSESVFLMSDSDNGYRLFTDISTSRHPDLVVDLAVSWPFKGEVFDLVVSTWVVEHLVTPELFFREAYRVLRKKGTLVCAVPFIYRKHGSPSDYYRFTDTALSHLARSAGFEQVRIQPVGGTPFICCVSLLWPLLRVPLVGFFMFLLALVLDRCVLSISQLTGKGKELIRSYPINYVVVSIK